jgi:hypothetical protein
MRTSKHKTEKPQNQKNHKNKKNKNQTNFSVGVKKLKAGCAEFLGQEEKAYYQ